MSLRAVAHLLIVPGGDCEVLTMKRIGLLCILGLATAGATVQAADPPDGSAEGSIETDSGRTEVLSRRVPVGRRIELPEGWYRVEEEGTEDRAVGSFTVVGPSEDRPSIPGETAPPGVGAGAEAQGVTEPRATEPRATESAPSMAGACVAQRSAFFRELWRESGIEVEDPAALLDGLDAGASGPATGYYWFALQTDAFRNLAWSTELRDRAKALVRCVRDTRAARR